MTSPSELWPPFGLVVRTGGLTLTPVTDDDLPVELVTDSYGMLSICLGTRSAASELRIDVGSEITLATPGDDDRPPPVTQPVTLREGTTTAPPAARA